MNGWKTFLVVCSIIFLLNGACSSEPALNKSKLAKVHAAALAVKTSIAEGASYQQVTDRVRELSREIQTLKSTVTSKREKDLLAEYADLLSMYKDGLVLWRYKLDFAFFDSVLKGRIYVGQDVEPIVIKYRFSTESHLYQPTGQYWKSIPGDSIQIVWSNADAQLKTIENMTNY